LQIGTEQVRRSGCQKPRRDEHPDRGDNGTEYPTGAIANKGCGNQHRPRRDVTEGDGGGEIRTGYPTLLGNRDTLNERQCRLPVTEGEQTDEQEMEKERDEERHFPPPFAVENNGMPIRPAAMTISAALTLRNAPTAKATTAMPIPTGLVMFFLPSRHIVAMSIPTTAAVSPVLVGWQENRLFRLFQAQNERSCHEGQSRRCGAG
jgi:hypothetical protein